MRLVPPDLWTIINELLRREILSIVLQQTLFICYSKQKDCRLILTVTSQLYRLLLIKYTPSSIPSTGSFKFKSKDNQFLIRIRPLQNAVHA